MRLRHRLHAGTTLAELIVAIVITASTAGGILAATTTSVQRIRNTNLRAIAFNAAVDQVECARVSARQGVLVEGTRTITVTPGSSPVASGQALPGDHLPSVTAGNFGATLKITRTVTLEAGATDVYRVSASADWTPASQTATGSTSLAVETTMRCPCD